MRGIIGIEFSCVPRPSLKMVRLRALSLPGNWEDHATKVMSNGPKVRNGNWWRQLGSTSDLSATSQRLLATNRPKSAANSH